MIQHIAQKRKNVFRLSTAELIDELNLSLDKIESNCQYPADELEDVYLRLFNMTYHIDAYEAPDRSEYDPTTVILMVATDTMGGKTIRLPIMDTIDEDDGTRYSDARSRLLRFRGILADM